MGQQITELPVLYVWYPGTRKHVCVHIHECIVHTFIPRGTRYITEIPRDICKKHHVVYGGTHGPWTPVMYNK